MRKWSWVMWCVGLLVIATGAEAARVALVIGNDSYTGARPLKNARSDARAMAQALRASGFEVELKEDLDREGMNEALRRFKGKISGGDEVAFYFSGHGVELGGSNLLLPVNVKAENEDRIRDDAVALQRVLKDLDSRKPRFTLVVLDACRNDPFEGFSKDVESRGLMPTMGAKGQMVIYAAGAGQKALDRLSEADRSPNGVFTRVFIEEMGKAGQTVLQAATKVRNRVVALAESVGHEQVPAVYDQSIGEFYFRKRDAKGATADADVKPPRVPGDGRADFTDLERAQQQEVDARRRWEERQKAMQSAFDKAKTLNATPEIAVQAWERFLGAHGEDNPYSTEDERLRTAAQSQLAAERERIKAPGTAPKPGPAATTGYADLQSFRDCDGCPEIVVIPAGEFEMGSPVGKGNEYEKPQHRVRVGRFALGKYEVTQGQWRALMGGNPSFFSKCGDECPVEQVSWEDAQAYIRKLNEKVTGRSEGPYRLPSEAEWEYGCRGGVSAEEYCGGSDVSSVAWYEGNSGGSTQQVGTKRGNRWGLHDLSGNVFEWVQDCWNESYQGAPRNGEAWTSGDCSRRVVRGGALYNFPASVRSAFRYWIGSAGRYYYLGFRLARTLP